MAASDLFSPATLECDQTADGGKENDCCRRFRDDEIRPAYGRDFDIEVVESDIVNAKSVERSVAYKVVISLADLREIRYSRPESGLNWVETADSPSQRAFMREQITRKKRNWRHRTAIAALLGILCIPIANEIARQVGAHVLGSFIEGKATIARVRLGLPRVRFEQITVWSPNCQQPALSVRKLTAELSILNGVRRGVWLEKIVVDRPQLQIHFDEAGKLITNLPSSRSNDELADPIATLPFGRLEVKNARLAIHQTGRETLDVDGMVFVAEAEASQLRILAKVPKLLAAKAQFHADINITSLEGNSELKVDGLRTTSDELARLPLTPKETNTQPWSMSVSW